MTLDGSTTADEIKQRIGPVESTFIKKKKIISSTKLVY